MWKILLGLVVGGGALALAGFKTIGMAGKVEAEPARMTARELIENGPGDNRHIELVDWLAMPDMVYAEDQSTRRWADAWAGFIPIDGQEALALAAAYENAERTGAPVRTPRVDVNIIAHFDIESETEYERLVERETITGVIINDVYTMDDEAMEMLAESYPHVDMNSVWYFDIGRKVPTAGAGYAQAGGGVLLALLGVGGFVRRAGKPD